VHGITISEGTMKHIIAQMYVYCMYSYFILMSFFTEFSLVYIMNECT